MPVFTRKRAFGLILLCGKPEFPLENTIANLNMDMVETPDKTTGNENYIYLIGSDKLSMDLHNTSEKANEKYVKMELDYRYNEQETQTGFIIDQIIIIFAKNNIPSIFYFSGLHEDYHKPTDTMEKLSFKKITSLTKLIFFTAWELSTHQKKDLWLIKKHV